MWLCVYVCVYVRVCVRACVCMCVCTYVELHCSVRGRPHSFDVRTSCTRSPLLLCGRWSVSVCHFACPTGVAPDSSDWSEWRACWLQLTCCRHCSPAVCSHSLAHSSSSPPHQLRTHKAKWAQQYSNSLPSIPGRKQSYRPVGSKRRNSTSDLQGKEQRRRWQAMYSCASWRQSPHAQAPVHLHSHTHAYVHIYN